MSLFQKVLLLTGFYGTAFLDYLILFVCFLMLWCNYFLFILFNGIHVNNVLDLAWKLQELMERRLARYCQMVWGLTRVLGGKNSWHVFFLRLLPGSLCSAKHILVIYFLKHVLFMISLSTQILPGPFSCLSITWQTICFSDYFIYWPCHQLFSVSSTRMKAAWGLGVLFISFSVYPHLWK